MTDRATWLWLIVGRLAVAGVWLYNGLWAKLLAGRADHAEVVASLPGVSSTLAQWGLVALGVVEVVLAIWVLTWWRRVAAAWMQTGLLVVMNAGGLIWAGETIAAPGQMIVSNAAFLCLVWLTALLGRPVRLEGGGTPWQRGRLDRRPGPPQLLFGRMHEDPSIEQRVFKPGGRILCIASSGDTAMTLARAGFDVTAIDLNPAQIAYVRRRLAGGEVEEGVTDRRLRWGRRLMPWLGLDPGDVRALLEMEDPSAQVRQWRQMVTPRLRAALGLLLHPHNLRRVYGPELVRELPEDFPDRVLARLERGMAMHPNRCNPWAWHLLMGEVPREAAEAMPVAAPADTPEAHQAADAATGRAPIRVLCADAVAFLHACPPGSFDGFSLSNITDGVPPAYAAELEAAVRHAGRPGARMVLRTLREPANEVAAQWAALDRALIWGGIVVRTIEGKLIEPDAASPQARRSS